MKWVGLTGGIGTGKSTVADILRQRSYEVIDADRIAREALDVSSPLFAEVMRVFGPAILNDQGEMNREKLAEIVFSDRQKKSELEDIVHPFVQKKVQERRSALESEGAKIVFYDLPLLFEKSLQNQFDKTVVVECDPKIQLQRIQARNPQWSLNEINNRIRNQLPLAEKVSAADYVIRNNGSLSDLDKQVDLLIEALLELKT